MDKFPKGGVLDEFPAQSNCPINEQTADGVAVGRCWFHLPDGKTCPRHGDVSKEVAYYKQTGRTTLESRRKFLGPHRVKDARSPSGDG